MKKVLSVALASAMVLGMGANAFAIQYNTGSNDKADWPSNFKFDGSLFVTDKNGDIITDATTDINDDEDVDFQPGDVIWMPLYADNQKDYSVEGNKTEYDAHKAGKVVVNTTSSMTSESGNAVNVTYTPGREVIVDNFKVSEGGVVFYHGYQAPETFLQLNMDNLALTNGIDTVKVSDINDTNADKFFNVVTSELGQKYAVSVTKDANNKIKGYEINGVVYDDKGLEALKEFNPNAINHIDKLIASIGTKDDAANHAMLAVGAVVNGDNAVKSGVKLIVTTNSFKAQKASNGKVVEVKGDGLVTDDEILGDDNVVEEYGYGHYTGNIDKNWSINLIEKSTGVAELVEKAELYKATKNDYLSYKDHTDEIEPNAVYLKVTLKKEWKTVSDETMKYYVYIANNKNNKDKTNEVWVSGKYAPTTKTVDFTWTNPANEPALWEAKESGVAVFDFADKAFFTVKMYKGETMYLDLETAYDNVIAGEMDAEPDSFYKFDKSNSKFNREGQLLIVSDDETLVPYEIDEDGNFVAVDAEYVKDYAVAHTNDKVNGFLFSTKQLGNYVLATEELGEEAPVEDGTDADENTVTPEPEVEEKPQTDKPNPNTGANDFVGLAVSLAVVSVAAAGALALKK